MYQRRNYKRRFHSRKGRSYRSLMSRPRFRRLSRQMLLRRYTRPSSNQICFTHESSKTFSGETAFSDNLIVGNLSVPEKRYIQLYKWFNVKYVIIDVMCLTPFPKPSKPNVPYLKSCFNSDQFVDYGADVIKSKSSSVTHPPLRSFTRILKCKPKVAVSVDTAIASRSYLFSTETLTVSYGKFEIASFYDFTAKDSSDINYAINIRYCVDLYGEDVAMIHNHLQPPAST